MYKRIAEYFPDTIIVNADTDKVILTRGTGRGVSEGGVYDIYFGGEIVGRFIIDESLADIAYGHVIQYKDTFPEAQACFKASFE